ncbi:MAG: hypothetical protein HQL56_13490 [Magnetococcales bacterium]|nr:hypothetical protein [Magnetococcales bacterium]
MSVAAQTSLPFGDGFGAQTVLPFGDRFGAQTVLPFGDRFGAQTILPFGGQVAAQATLPFGDRYVDRGDSLRFGDTPVEMGDCIGIGQGLDRQDRLTVAFRTGVDAATGVLIGFSWPVTQGETLAFSVLNRNPVDRQERLTFSLLERQEPIGRAFMVKGWVGGDLL